MMEIINPQLRFEFTKNFSKSSVLTLIVIIAGLSLVLFKGLNYGVDFRGGAEVQVKFEKPIVLKKLRTILEDAGQKVASVQAIGALEENEFLIKLQADTENLNFVTGEMTKVLNEKVSEYGVSIRKTDIVGPKAGAELRISGFKAMLYAVVAILIYVGLRFDFKYAPGAIMALVHDVLIILGVFVLTEKEFTLQIVAALLAVIGYSVNDTVIIYDRVREHEQSEDGKPLADSINLAASETLSRTIITSGTTLFISLAMFIWGGSSIQDFFFAISLGIFVGTYSSIFVAAPVTLFFDKFKA